MANCYGGLILLGVSEKEDGGFVTAGLDVEDVEKLRRDLWSVLNDGKKVSVNLLAEEDVKDCKVGEDLVLSIRVRLLVCLRHPLYLTFFSFIRFFEILYAQNLGPHIEQNSAFLNDSCGKLSSCSSRALWGSKLSSNCLFQSKAYLASLIA